MVGAFDDTEIEECEEAKLNVMEKLDETFWKHTISHCSKQIVNGINHKMILVNDDHEIDSCDLVVWRDFHGKEFKILQGRAPYRDCYTLLRELKEKKEGEKGEEEM